MTPTEPRPGRPAWSRRHLLAACTGLALLALAAARPVQAEGRLVQVDIVDRDSGRPLHVWRDHGRAVVAGRPGSRYAVRLANRSPERVMVVVAIDGVDILTGETASTRNEGYVLEPWQQTSLTGWRKSRSEVAAFEFAALEASYAARTGRPADVGVIGVAVFREQVPVEQPIALDREPAAPAREDSKADAGARAKAGPESSAARPEASLAPLPSPAPTGRIGTAHGARERSDVIDVPFDRLPGPPHELVTFRYDSLPNLMAAGIVPRPTARAGTPPRAFPGDAEPGFVPDPPAR